MRRAALSVTAAATVAAIAAAAASAAAPGDIKLTPVKSKFPERSYVISLPPGVALSEPTVTVVENGGPVADVALSPTRAAAGSSFGTVLLIDTSNSMMGGPLANAFDAARAFAGKRNTNQRLGIVTFDGRARVKLGLSSDGDRIVAALARTPATAEGTHLYDGIARALSLIKKAGIASGSIVLLSDGADTGSVSNGANVLARAKALHVRIFAVGLTSPQFDPTTLQSIAAQTGASYSTARSAADLTQIYDDLGYKLANEYLLQYKSFADPKQHVVVQVAVAGVDGGAKSDYESPPLPVAVAVPSAVHRSLADRFMASSVTMLVVVALIAALLGFAATAVLRTRGSDLRRRLGAFVSVQEDAAEGDVVGATEDTAARRTPWERFVLDVEIAEIDLAPTQIAVVTLLLTILLVWVGSVLNLILAVLALLLPFLVRFVVKNMAERKKRQFGEQLPDNLQVLSSALRAGHSLIGALSVVVTDAPEPSRREFRQVVADEQVGVPLDDAMRRVAERMGNRDLEQIALVAALQRETGGSAAEVLDRVAETVRDRAALRRLVRVLTAQGRMARWIVSGLPVGLLLVISVLNSSYMTPMFTKPLGQLMLAFAFLMVVAGSLVIRKIVDIKV
jgi:tight adherence protein B